MSNTYDVTYSIVPSEHVVAITLGDTAISLSSPETVVSVSNVGPTVQVSIPADQISVSVAGVPGPAGNNGGFSYFPAGW